MVTYSPAVDVYGLGATLYTMLVGHAPYRLSRVDGDHSPEVHFKIRKKMEKETFNQRSRAWQSASPQFKKLVSACLERDPSKRPQLSEILVSDWVQQNNSDPDVDIIPPPEEIVVDLSEDTMETPAEVLAKEQMPPPKPVAARASVSEPQVAAAEPSIEDEELVPVLDIVFDSEFEPDFLGFDENVPQLRLPSEYYEELQLPPVSQVRQTATTLMLPPAAPPPVPALLSIDIDKRPRTRQQRRTELRQTAGTPPEPEDTKAGLYLLMQQLAPPVEDDLPAKAAPRLAPPRPLSPRPLDDLNGFKKVKATWQKSRASWRHFCLLLNGVQQVLKHRFKKQRRVYCDPAIKVELLNEAYEKPLIFPRPRPPAKRRVKPAPKVPRPPTRVQPERARALRQRYVFE